MAPASFGLVFLFNQAGYFNLDFKKLIVCLIYFASHCSDMTKLKAIKLSYFLDKYHLVKYGRPVLGDNYVLMGLGSVPSMTLDIINEIQDAYQHKIKMLDPTNKEYSREQRCKMLHRLSRTIAIFGFKISGMTWRGARGAKNLQIPTKPV